MTEKDFIPTLYINTSGTEQLRLMIAHSDQDGEDVVYTRHYDMVHNEYTSATIKSHFRESRRAVFFTRSRVKFFMADAKPIR